MRFAHGDAPTWPEARKAEVEEIIARYPDSRSAVMPLLHLAQAERGWVAQEDLEAVGRILGLSTAYVDSTASFYAMYHRHPVGKYVITVCTNLSCHLAGAGKVLETLEKTLGIKPGETTKDGLITLEGTSECLAACDAGPVAQVNVEYFLRLTPGKAETLVEALRSGDAEALAGLAEHGEAGAEAVLSARVREVPAHV
ncbi:MAG: NADH-quinone oxidoreductase subunit NuoE [Bacillota bacterium]